METRYRHQTFRLENQDGCGEDTYLEIDEMPNGKVSVTVSGEDEPYVFFETFGEEIRILIYNDYEEEPDIVVLPSISGAW